MRQDVSIPLDVEGRTGEADEGREEVEMREEEERIGRPQRLPQKFLDPRSVLKKNSEGLRPGSSL